VTGHSGVALGTALALGLAAPGFLDTVAAQVNVRITSIKASPAGPSDRPMRVLRPRLRRLVGYPAYRIVRSEERRCAFHRRQAFRIPGGRMLWVVPKGMQQGTMLIRVKLTDGRRALVDTDFRLRDRGTMVLGVDRQGPANNGALLIMLRAEE